MALGTPVIGAASTFVAAATTLSVPYPTMSGPGYLALVLGAHPDTMSATTPTGWTGIANIAGGAGTFGLNTGPVRAAGFVKNADGETGSLTVTVTTATNSAAWGRIVYIPSGGGPMSAAGVGGTDTTTGTAWSVTFGSNPGIQAGDVCITSLAIPTATQPTYASSALAATGATFTESFLADPTAAVGNGGGGHVESWTVTGTASAAAVHTIALSGTTTNDAGGEVLLRFRELPRVSGVPGRRAARPPVSVRRARAAVGSTEQVAIPTKPGRVVQRRAQVVVRRAQPALVPPQVAPASPLSAVARRGFKALQPRRRTRVEVVPPQIAAAPPPYVPSPARRGFKGWQPRRRIRAEVVPPQIVVAPPPHVPRSNRRGFKGWQTPRHTRADVTPAQQAAPVAPKYVPQPPRRGLKGIAAPRHRAAEVPSSQVAPPGARTRRLGRPAPRRRTRLEVVPPQVAPVAPPPWVPHTAPRHALRGLLRRVSRTIVLAVNPQAPLQLSDVDVWLTVAVLPRITTATPLARTSAVQSLPRTSAAQALPRAVPVAVLNRMSEED